MPGYSSDRGETRDLPPHLTAPQNELAVALPENALALADAIGRIVRQVERELIRRALVYKLKAHGLERSYEPLDR